MKAQELPGFTATVDEVIYMDSLETPPDRPYAFVYFITISNKSKVSLTVKGRKWVIESKNRDKLVVEDGQARRGGGSLAPEGKVDGKTSKVLKARALKKGRAKASITQQLKG